MSGIRPRLSHIGPNTYAVSAAVKGGMLVEPTGPNLKTVRPASAGSRTVLGVAEADAKPWVNPVSTDADGFETVNTSPLPTETAVGFARYPVRFAADAGFGVALKAAANGQVTPWVQGTDAADLVVGYCDEPGGVIVASKPVGLANISR